MVSVLRPGQRILQIPAIGVQTSRRAVASGAANGLLNNLVAYWPLNEAAGANNALDLHTNGLTLTQASSPDADTGKVYSTARTFAGSADCFYRNSQALLQTGDVDFTFAAWCYGAFVTGEVILCKWNFGANTREYYVLRDSGGTLQFLVSANGVAPYGTVTVSEPTANAWHLVCAWHDSVANKIYIQVDDGTPANADWSSGVYSSTSQFVLGALRSSDGIAGWNGRLGPVAMWKSAAGGGGVLSSSQRSALWNAGAGLPYASFTV